jgi:hypothetical protein
MESCCSRRDLLKKSLTGAGLGFFGLGLVSRFFMEEAYGLVPDTTLQKYDACIHIWYAGGPSQTDTWDPKPGSTSNIFPTINLGTNDIYGRPIYLTNLLPNIANLVMNDPAIGLGIVRSMTHKNGAHGPASQWMASFWQSPVALQYPTFSAVMAYLYQDKVSGNVEIPSVVMPPSAYGQALNDSRGSLCPTALVLNNAPALLNPPVTDAARYQRRKQFMDTLAQGYLATRPDATAQAWKNATDRAYAATTSGKALAAFDLSGKTVPTGGPTAYASDLSNFLQAQEAVKGGIPYFGFALGANDYSHNDNVNTVTNVWKDTTDPALAQIAKNLKATGLRVLIVLGGEFGRGPADPTMIDAKTGLPYGPTVRGHWPDGFSWAFISINQPAFKTTAVGYTGPDGTYTTGTLPNDGGAFGGSPASAIPLVDPVSPGALGGFIYRSLGFPVGTGSQWNVPTALGMRSPVDVGMATSTARGGAVWLQQQFGLA